MGSDRGSSRAASRGASRAVQREPEQGRFGAGLARFAERYTPAYDFDVEEPGRRDGAAVLSRVTTDHA
jgi:hypothetical protein